MLGRLIGLLAGLVVAALGYGLYDPAGFAGVIPNRYLDLAHVPLGPFAQYKAFIGLLVLMFGLAMGLAALQRRTTRSRPRPKPALKLEPESGEASGSEPEEIDLAPA